jgi:hypothetical protein
MTMTFPRGVKTVFRICLGILAGLVLLLPVSAQMANSTGTYRTEAGCSPCDLQFGDVKVGASSTLPSSVTNYGTQNITLVGMTRTDSEFVSNLSFPLTLVPGQTVRFMVIFQPNHKGSINAGLNLMNKATQKLEFHVHGNGVSGGVLAMNPSAISFGSVQVGSTSSKSETLTNNGGTPLEITNAVVSDQEFSFSGLNLPLHLDPQHSYTFTVTYTPNNSGNDSGNIAFSYQGTTAKLPLSGTGVTAGTLVVSPATMDFGQVTVGKNKSISGSLKASGTTITVSSATLSNSQYTLSGLTFPLTITSGQSVPYSITFAPQSSGTITATASFANNGSNSTASQSLTGVGSQSQSHNVGLTWDASTSDVVGYNIYRGNVSGGPYNKINGNVDPNTSYSDGTVLGGYTYFYVTTAVDSTGQESVYSNEVKAIIPAP